MTQLFFQFRKLPLSRFKQPPQRYLLVLGLKEACGCGISGALLGLAHKTDAVGENPCWTCSYVAWKFVATICEENLPKMRFFSAEEVWWRRQAEYGRKRSLSRFLRNCTLRVYARSLGHLVGSYVK